MQVIVFGKDVYRLRKGATFHANVPYVLNDQLVLEIEESMQMSGFDLIEERRPFKWKQWQYPERVENLLVYVTGKIGDMLWLTCVLHELKQLMPQMRITLITAWAEVFERNRDIASVRFQPLPLSSLTEFDGVIVLDEPVAKLREVDQANCYRVLFEAFGMPFDTNDLSRYKPHMKLLREDEESAFASFLSPGQDMSLFHLVLGLHSSAHTRNLAPHQWKEIVAYFADRFKDHKDWYIYGLSDDERVGGAIQTAILELGLPNYRPIHNRLSIRQIAALVRTACCVVTVDSMMAHLAAAFNTACVPIMTTVPPNIRTGTYPLARPIWKGSACQYAPCNWKRDKFREQTGPRIEILPCYVPTREYCDVALAVSVEDVALAFNEACQAKELFDHYELHPLPKQ